MTGDRRSQHESEDGCNLVAGFRSAPTELRIACFVILWLAGILATALLPLGHQRIPVVIQNRYSEPVEVYNLGLIEPELLAGAPAGGVAEFRLRPPGTESAAFRSAAPTRAPSRR